MKERQAERRLDRRRPQVSLYPFEDGGKADQLPVSVKAQDRFRQVGRPVGHGEPFSQGQPNGRGTNIAPGALQVRLIRGCLALLKTSPLVATDCASIALPLEGQVLPLGGPIANQPGELVGDQGPVARRTARGKRSTDGELEARVASGRGAHGRERSVEMPKIGRPKDDLREETGQRVRLERDGPTLSINRRPGNPATSGVEIEDHVPWTGSGLEVRNDHVGRWRWRDPLERGHREPGLGA